VPADDPQCPRCLEFAEELEQLRQRVTASGHFVAYLPGPNPNPDVEGELKRWLAVNPRADASAGFRAGWRVWPSSSARSCANGRPFGGAWRARTTGCGPGSEWRYARPVGCLEEDRDREDFLGLVTPELKTPVAVIKAYAELLEAQMGEQHLSEPNRAAIREVVGHILDQAELMSGLIEEIQMCNASNSANSPSQ
jgi:hypothetical protein